MRVDRVTVLPERVDVLITVGGAETLRTSADERVSERAMEMLPGLGRHRCDNNQRRTFADEIGDTEVPHLFEHVVLELMALAGSPRSLRGETVWDFRRDGDGVFRVSLEYDDDLVCLGAIKAAGRVVRYVLDGGKPPDIGAEREDLLALRRVPATSGEPGV